MSTTEIILSLQQVQIATYFNVASIAVLVYDWFLTFELELASIWSAPWNLGTLLYITARYPAFADTLLYFYREVGYSVTTPHCKEMVSISSLMFLISGGVAEVIMVACVWVMWGRTRKMAIFLIILTVGAAAASIIGLYDYGNSETFITLSGLPPNVLNQCQIITHGTRGQIYIYFLALVILESVLLSLILCKAAQHDSGHRSAVVSKCFRHGIMYYVVLDALSVINLAISIQRAQGIDGLLASIQRAFHAILSGRMLLHLRYSARQWAREYVNTTSISLGGEIRFRPRLEDSTNTNDRSRMSVI